MTALLTPESYDALPDPATGPDPLALLENYREAGRAYADATGRDAEADSMLLDVLADLNDDNPPRLRMGAADTFRHLLALPRDDRFDLEHGNGEDIWQRAHADTADECERRGLMLPDPRNAGVAYDLHLGVVGRLLHTTELDRIRDAVPHAMGVFVDGDRFDCWGEPFRPDEAAREGDTNPAAYASHLIVRAPGRVPPAVVHAAVVAALPGVAWLDGHTVNCTTPGTPEGRPYVVTDWEDWSIQYRIFSAPDAADDLALCPPPAF